MASQKQQLKRAVSSIRDGLKASIDKLEDETAFTVSSRDVGITNPDMQKDVSKKQVARGAMGAAYLAADVALNPQKYTSRAIKDKASRETVKEIARQGERIVNRMLPEGLNLNLDFKSMGLEDVQRGRRPAVGAGYERPVEFGGLKGSAGVQGRYDPESGSSYVGARFTGRFAKGGKVKPYAKGGGVRKPKLK